MNSLEIKKWVTGLLSPKVYDHDVENIRLIETHISWVILTGHYVYKIKKPVNLSFLDFSTLAKRHFYCYQELIINKRLAADYYLAVVPIYGSYASPRFVGDGEVLDYAVKMKQFPQAAQLDRLLERGCLTEKHIDSLAQKLASFHNVVSRSSDRDQFGSPSHVHQPVLNCYQEMLARIDHKETLERIESLRRWSNNEFEKKIDVFKLRKKQGFVRECHGDLHLKNIAIDGNELVIFDAIEFSEDLRWSDVICEIAFLIMDLDEREQQFYSRRFLNRYLEITGDYSGLQVFRYYLVYRAMVRAMVSCIRISQENMQEDEKEFERQEFMAYLSLAEFYTEINRPYLFIMHGLSGSGKTTVSQKLIEATPVIRLRSDIERKRLFNIAEKFRSDVDTQKIIYSDKANKKTYEKLRIISEDLIQSGFSVVVDATFQKNKLREPFRKLAQTLSVSFVIIHCEASIITLKQRVVLRVRANNNASDADLGVLEKQIQAFEPHELLEKDSLLLIVNTDKCLSHRKMIALLESVDIVGFNKSRFRS